MAECHGQWRNAAPRAIGIEPRVHIVPIATAHRHGRAGVADRRASVPAVGATPVVRRRGAAAGLGRSAPLHPERMFTGLVTHTGTLAARSPRGPGARLAFDARFDDGPLVLGESIAIDGVCLSVDSIGPSGFEVDASAETLSRTTLAELPVGGRVHFERALRAGDRLGGHMVTGHVDGVGTLVERRPLGEATWMDFRLPAPLARFVAEKGSIAIDGVSLTVNRAEGDRFEVTLIPHTLQKTKLGELRAGQAVNVEVDLVARYVARLASA